MTKIIYSVGFESPDDQVERVSFRSRKSLLDADIVLFSPILFQNVYGYAQEGYPSSNKMFQGKPCLNETNSFNVVEDESHWRTEIKAAYEAGLTIFVFLAAYEQVSRYTGEKTYSGTGRSRVTTNVVEFYDNYKALPLKITRVVPSNGTEIRVNDKLRWLAPYWAHFRVSSEYQIYLEGEIGQTAATTKDGNRMIAACMIGSKGAIILLPALHYDLDFFHQEGKNEGQFNHKGIQWGKRLTATLIEVHKALKADRQTTPPPDWATESAFRLKRESQIEGQITAINNQIQALQGEHTNLLSELESEGGLRRLLYEQGAPLEAAILDALKFLGFDAKNYKNSESEFDVVFLSEEGRFLGEAEGKDDKAINIDKLSQLERNIQEDFAREEVSEHAKGVLFGNAYRLKRPEDRGEFFTQKCILGAKRAKVALVRTTDLFAVARYLKESSDNAYAKQCRKAIFSAEGEIVSFPSLTQLNEKHTVDVKQSE